MSKKIPRTLFEKHKAIQQIGTTVEVPFSEVSRLLHGSGHRQVTLAGDQICLGGDDADCGSLEELRIAIEWYVIQLGGDVTWER